MRTAFAFGLLVRALFHPARSGVAARWSQCVPSTTRTLERGYACSDASSIAKRTPTGGALLNAGRGLVGTLAVAACVTVGLAGFAAVNAAHGEAVVTTTSHAALIAQTVEETWAADESPSGTRPDAAH